MRRTEIRPGTLYAVKDGPGRVRPAVLIAPGLYERWAGSSIVLTTDRRGSGVLMLLDVTSTSPNDVDPAAELGVLTERAERHATLLAAGQLYSSRGVRIVAPRYVMCTWANYAERGERENRARAEDEQAQDVRIAALDAAREAVFARVGEAHPSLVDAPIVIGQRMRFSLGWPELAALLDTAVERAAGGAR